MYKTLTCCILVGLLSLTSCIKDELPNIEADITDVVIDEDAGLLNAVFHNTTIDVYADPAIVNPANVKIGYEVSKGAVISPDPATVTDYSQPRFFTVTSEDGEWERTYEVRIVYPELPTHYDFEHWMTPEKQRYMIPYQEYNGDERLYLWACGNAAFSFLTSGKDDYKAFPTQPTDDAKVGKTAAKLVTMLTGQLDKPIAAGNLFIGQFDAKLRDPLESTQFGLPFTKKPLRFTGWYKYHSGGLTYKTKREDHCRLQAVLYRTDSNFKHLNGYTIQGDPHIVARADIPENEGTSTDGQWVKFDLEFIYTEPIDPDLLKKGGYNLAVIFSASRYGYEYDGAPGSVMIVDDVEIVCE